VINYSSKKYVKENISPDYIVLFFTSKKSSFSKFIDS
jgi:hypothetical protein